MVIAWLSWCDIIIYHKINNWFVDGKEDLRYYYRQINKFAGD